MKIYNNNMSQLLGRPVYDDAPGQNVGFNASTPSEARRGFIIIAVGFSIMGLGALIKILVFG